MQNILRKQMSKGGGSADSDRLELREMEDRLLPHAERESEHRNYGSGNRGFQDAAVGTDTAELADDMPSVVDEVGQERDTWDSKMQFIMATIGYAVGLGNVWRFPYLAQKNGGGAFLIPYFLMLIVEGIPVFYLELAVGQRLRKGAIGAWSLVSPYLAGIGVTSAVVSFNVALYYNTIIAWCLYYFSQSLQSPLPWSECPKIYFPNGTFINEAECERSSPTEYFWYRRTLDISESIEHPEGFNWKIALCLLSSWLLCYLCMSKGIASSGKVVYVTATFPYMVLIIFFFRGITLDGMSDGLLHFITPQWDKLADPVVWLEAGTQIFFSLGLAFGGLIAFASYNPVHNDCYRDAILVSLTNCGTSFFAGIVVFSVLGFKAHMTHKRCMHVRSDMLSLLNQTITTTTISSQYLSETSVLPYEPYINRTAILAGLPICDLHEELSKSASGTGLAFMAFTEAVNQFPGAPFWSLLFFLMLFTLGIDSQFGTLEGVISALTEMQLFPNLPKQALTGGLCTVLFVLSLVFANGAGNYIFTLFDNYAGNFPLLIVAFFECIAISYAFGVTRFSDDIEVMTGKRPSLYWQICWRYLSPSIMVIILTASFIKMASGGAHYEAWDEKQATTVVLDWPMWAICLAIFLIFIAAIWIPLIALLRLCKIELLPKVEESWFPAEELRDFHNLPPHKISHLERMLFCVPSDDERPIENRPK